jgi:hypothetical protein
VKGMELLHDLPRGGSRGITRGSGSFDGHGNHVRRRPTGVKRCTAPGPTPAARLQPARRPSGRSNDTPRSRSDTNASCPTTR